MMDGSSVLDVRIAKDTNSPLESLTIAHLVPNRGIEGDRYYYNAGSFSTGEMPAYDVSIIEEDMYQQLVQESLHTGNLKALRRNIVVSGDSLAMLIDRPFQIGTTLFRGIIPRRLSHFSLEQLASMRLSTGIGAQVLSEGNICLGDEVCMVKALATS
ncbi:MAG TPA: MOSC domain-containing protein [Ktedonobacteraceae bacterium]